MATTAAPSSAAEVRPADVPLTRGRTAAVWTLLVLATLLGVLTILTTWVNRQMLSDASWETAAAKTIQDPAVQSALSTYLVNALYDNVDVTAALQEKLPPNVQGLAGPIAGALRQPATNSVETLLKRPRVQQLWINVNVRAHQRLVNVLEDKTGNGITTGNGTVTLDLRELLINLAQSLGLPGTRLQQLPPEAGQITILRSDQLSTAQNLVQILRALSIWLFALVFVLYGLAIYLARGHRRAILRNVGWAFIVIGLLTLIARRWIGNYVIGTLVTEEWRAPFHNVWLIGSSILGDIGRATVLYGLIAVLGAVLAGPTRTGTAVRRFIAPTLNERPAMAWGAAAGVFLLLVLWGGTHALRVWWGILLLGALLALGVWALRQQTLEEFPSAAPTPDPEPPPAAPAGA